jgi:hypothetical protein
MTWRQATREEIYSYYTKEFPRHVDSLPEFITAEGPKQYAMSFRDPYPVRKDDVPDKDFIRRDTWQTAASGERRNPEFSGFQDVEEFIQHPARTDPIGRSTFALADPEVTEKPEPRPDAVYYALDHWERPWVLLVDIDAKDIARKRAAHPVSRDLDDQDDHALLRAAGILDAAPAGYPYAFEDVDRAIEYGFEVRDIFEDYFDAEDTMVVYSGQGVHVYLLDTDPAHRYDEQSREVLNDLLLETFEIPIDPVVTADRRRVARLPYSLHAEVSSIVQPIESPDFDVQSATPAVIKE